MGRALVIATAGAGGDLQPLVSAAEALRARGHATSYLGDSSVARAVGDAETLPPQLDLGPRLVATVRSAMEASGGDASRAGPLVRDGLTAWAREVAAASGGVLSRERPDLIVTSLFGVEVLHELAPDVPWAVINSTFYVGPTLQRAAELDFAPRAVPLLVRYASLLGDASRVLHATDQEFDFGFTDLPESHRYVGPLGIWESPSDGFEPLDEPGDPWVLVTISSQMQDDIPLARAAIDALADAPVRVVVTLGPDHDPEELGAVASDVHVRRTVSHASVLRRASLLVSHAGHGSVMKALWHGVPMVLVPWGRDQPGVAARAAALGVAEIVARDSEDLGPAIARALASDAMRQRARHHSVRLQATDPQAVAASALEELLT